MSYNKLIVDMSASIFWILRFRRHVGGDCHEKTLANTCSENIFKTGDFNHLIVRSI